MENSLQHVTIILGRLIDCTDELARCEANADTDIVFLTRECSDCLEKLQQILPAGIRSGGDESGDAIENETIEKMLRALEEKTKRSMEVLSRCRDRTEEELLSLRRTRVAVRAYEKHK